MKTIPVTLILSLFVVIAACSKDKFESKPRLEVKEYSHRELYPGQDLRITLNYYDKEGDLGNQPAIGIIDRQNIFPLGSTSQDKADTFRVSLPEFPDRDKGEIFFQLPYGYLKESLVENDSLLFRFSVTDRAGNTSDTITSEMVVIMLE